MSAARRRKKKKGRMSLSRRIALWAFLALALGYLLVAWAAISFVHHPKEWRREREQSWPGFATATLYWVGNGLSDLTDGLGLTGYDVVYEYDTEPPSGSALFAGAPKRVGNIQPADITVLDRGEFVVGWSPSLRRPVWCAYHVVPDVLYQTDKRPNFTKDKDAENSPAAAAYGKSGYDRGHLTPAGDMVFSREAMSETFYMSNMCPQAAAFNRGIWKDLEDQAREWARLYGAAYVVSGPVLSKPASEYPFIGQSKVAVPEFFYKAILVPIYEDGLDQTGAAALDACADVIAIAFVIPNKGCEGDFWRYAKSVDEAEEITGLDFFPLLEDDVENRVEAECDPRPWY